MRSLSNKLSCHVNLVSFRQLLFITINYDSKCSGHILRLKDNEKKKKRRKVKEVIYSIRRKMSAPPVVINGNGYKRIRIK